MTGGPINVVMAITLGVLYSAGFYLLLQRSLMRIIIGIVIIGHGANLFLQSAGGPPGRPPILGGVEVEEMTDPLPQAMALTAIVITFALSTFLLALAYRSSVLLGHDEVRDDVEDRRIRRLQQRLAEDEDDDDENETDDHEEAVR
ncbi:Na(+)/H(+) antiporter subunit C [Actinoalloteichus hymeniacidonis]|uniref:Multisubunit sodium/proton antiporter, MrpC subunit n=1 Tax=Actinoalloteichus hymeniacidonis TaxID=340345 RepID=A0AAC9N0G9_9PSEU|nr:Na(+)/H(+) antiporter subunit C [Actinoalloteichus hymeniacidonis]AOS65579.1 multisubunit sodium/proton antiporter, MrpC subunit [Actinoalloteichus hymeniacidonis]MBB5906331.1 multicomponent Na+:H+ antiporter subunit C [Actinoalloteichus hymeniacidonis]